MRDALRRICELQPSYSASNTVPMQERGRILRREVKPGLEAMQPQLAAALGRFGGDFLVEAGDGIGRKTELPWVRFCSKVMSPRPTEGFYCVIHFSTDGSAVHVTLGCGSSRFHKGSAVPLPDKELDAQSEWARKVIIEGHGTLDPFSDPPNFGAKRPLPRSFERATAIAKRIEFSDIEDADIENLLEQSAHRLQLIYRAQVAGRNLSPADQAELEIAELLVPHRSAGMRQGYGLSAAARRVVEQRAMAIAEEWLRTNGYDVVDCSARFPFDLEAKKGASSLKVEVKGTTSDRADAVLMTSAEVRLHQAESGQTALIIVSRIRVGESDGKHIATGGEPEVLLGWDIGGWDVEPIAFRVTRR